MTKHRDHAAPDPTPPSPADPELTAVILTYNESAHIEACISSLRWADRILVFDRFSDDNTVELSTVAGAEVSQETFQDFAQQRNAALDSLETEWVFFVDADERGSPELAREIRELIRVCPEAGWYVPRHNYIFERLTLGAGWYPDYQLRLFRHGRVRYERPVHEVAIVDGEVGHLQNTLVHLNYRDPAHFHEKQRSYTKYDATVLYEQGTQPNFYTPYTQPVRQFVWRFLRLKGYQDGFHGLRLSLYMAYYEWQKYRHLARLQRND